MLRHCIPGSIRQTLKQLPKSLDDTYLRVLSQIPQANQVHAHRLLQCLVVAVRPLRVEELAELLFFFFLNQFISRGNRPWTQTGHSKTVVMRSIVVKAPAQKKTKWKVKERSASRFGQLVYIVCNCHGPEGSGEETAYLNPLIQYPLRDPGQAFLML